MIGWAMVGQWSMLTRLRTCWVMGRGLDQPGLNTSQLVNKWMALVHGLVDHCELRLAYRAWRRSWPGLRRPTVDRVSGGRDEAVASAGPVLGAKAPQAEPLMDPRPCLCLPCAGGLGISRLGVERGSWNRGGEGGTMVSAMGTSV